MKSILAIVVFVFSPNIFADFSSFERTFDRLVLPSSAAGEFVLEFKVYKSESHTLFEEREIASEILFDLRFEGLQFIHMVQVSSVENTVTFFESESYYYCHRLVKNFRSTLNSRSKCRAALKKLLRAVFNVPDLEKVSLMQVGGNYYGDWKTNFLILKKEKEALAIEFDLIHEI